MRPIPLLIIALLVVTVANVLARQRIAQWSAVVTDTGAVVTDCRHCGFDVGVLLECDKGARQARLRLMSAALPDGKDGDPVDMVLSVDGVSETRTARLAYQAMQGEVPLIELSLDDPLLAHLAGGVSLHLRTTTGEKTIPLDGSANALATFRHACI